MDRDTQIDLLRGPKLSHLIPGYCYVVITPWLFTSIDVGIRIKGYCCLLCFVLMYFFIVETETHPSFLSFFPPYKEHLPSMLWVFQAQGS